jgi:two-component system sensor histidine kinase QseC
LLALLLTVVAAAWFGTAAFTYVDTRSELDELLDAHLAQSAALLVAQAGGELHEIETDQTPAVHGRKVKVMFQIWERGSMLRLRSAGAPAERLAVHEQGFSDVSLQGKSWRVFSTWDGAHRNLVQVAEEQHLRDEIIEDIAESLLLPLAIALPLLGLFLWLAVTRAVRPLRRLGQDIARRAPDNLSRLDPGDAPAEIAPLVDNLNRLFSRVGDALENERRFTADAAHELRTPLAALKIQAQVARAALDAAERQRALDNVIAGCDRATRLVEQLLTLARLEPTELKTRHVTCDLSAITREVAATIAPFALARGIEIELDAPASVELPGTLDLLRVLVRNLVDNAVRYSPASGVVSVSLSSSNNQVTLSVLDQGPGVTPEERANLGRRFHRVLGSGESGSGLGLSIVKRIAELHHASITFGAGEAGRGLRVKVSFPSKAD